MMEVYLELGMIMMSALQQEGIGEDVDALLRSAGKAVS
jgi:hypothetical protein